MGKSIDRTGEKGVNNFGSKMIITRYGSATDIDVYFSEYNWTFKHSAYKEFKNGNIKCPYERRYFGVGYLGEGDYRVSENRKNTRVYKAWYNMIRRCYDEKLHEKRPTYIGCEVCKEWHNFQNFAKWYYKNYYAVGDEKMCLDKDILIKHNKIYSPETCMFVPKTINSLFVKRDNDRGESCIGTSPKNGKYQVNCCMINPETGKSKCEYLGCYDTQEKAFQIYKEFKERYIKRVADHYKDQIPEKLYDALYNYKVEITD